jgi:predicted nucleotidyltransferase
MPMAMKKNKSKKSRPSPKPSKKLLINSIVETLENEERVLFAYLYGSAAAGEKGNDIDIAVYSATDADPYKLSADLKVDLNKKTGIAPDNFDVRILNTLVERGDIFDLLYLRNVLTAGRILVDKNPKARGDFLERYGMRFRECEGLMQEVLA